MSGYPSERVFTAVAYMDGDPFQRNGLSPASPQQEKSASARNLTRGRPKDLLRSRVHAVHAPGIAVEGDCTQGAHCVHD